MLDMAMMYCNAKLWFSFLTSINSLQTAKLFLVAVVVVIIIIIVVVVVVVIVTIFYNYPHDIIIADVWCLMIDVWFLL